MFDPKAFDDLAQRMAALVPPGMKELQQEMEKNFRAVLQNTFTKLDLVTREEFDVQQELLNRTRAKVDSLETRVESLEAQLHRDSSSTKDME